MKTKLLALALLLMLLSAPLAQVVYAEEPTGGDDAGDGTDGDGAGDDTNGDGDDGGNGNIDPFVYQQIKEDTEARWWNLYYLYTGQQGGEDEGDGDGTGDGDGDDGTGEYDGPEIREDLDTELRNQLMNAWMEMKQAEQMEVENLQTAAQQHLRVMRLLRNTWRKYQKDNPDIVDDTTEPPDDPVGGEDKLPTYEELTEIQEQLVERFQKRFNDSIKEMFLFYNGVEDDLDPDDAMKAYNALYHAKQKLLRIQERINAGDYEGAIDDLENAGNDLDDEYDDMDPQSAQLFKTATKLQAKIEKMIEKKERKAAQGEDTSGDDDLINQLKGNIDKAKNDHKENKGKGNDNGNGNGNDKDKEKKPKKEKDK